MLGRHHSHPDRQLTALVDAFHDRLAGTTVTNRTDPPRIDPRDLRIRLGRSPGIGLRARLDRPYSAT